MHTPRQRRGREPGMTRRRFLELTAAGTGWLVFGEAVAPCLAAQAGEQAASAPATYRVGLGHAVPADPYGTAQRAIEACGEWPVDQIAGRRVVIKPNLVMPLPAATGVTTDPQVVRLLVDLALEAGAAQVQIVEGGMNGASFSACGYDFFDGYDPQGRVSLVDLGQEPVTLAQVPGGMAYKHLYIPTLLLGPDVFFVSVAKLKTHAHTHVSLSMKNLIGLPPVQIYHQGWERLRQVMHRRGISQVIVDCNSVRPVDFAVVDGIVGMEGNGPGAGTPVGMDMVVAGRNAVAVDRTCLWAMDIPQGLVKHLGYAAQKGMGPTRLDEIERVGDAIEPRSFAWPSELPPLLTFPVMRPSRFEPSAGEVTRIKYSVFLDCRTQAEVVQVSDRTQHVSLVRTLHELRECPAGIQTLTWDGRDDAGGPVAPGRYTVRVMANYRDNSTNAYATGWVTVVA